MIVVWNEGSSKKIAVFPDVGLDFTDESIPLPSPDVPPDGLQIWGILTGTVPGSSDNPGGRGPDLPSNGVKLRCWPCGFPPHRPGGAVQNDRDSSTEILKEVHVEPPPPKNLQTHQEPSSRLRILTSSCNRRGMFPRLLMSLSFRFRNIHRKRSQGRGRSRGRGRGRATGIDEKQEANNREEACVEPQAGLLDAQEEPASEDTSSFFFC